MRYEDPKRRGVRGGMHDYFWSERHSCLPTLSERLLLKEQEESFRERGALSDGLNEYFSRSLEANAHWLWPKRKGVMGGMHT